MRNNKKSMTYTEQDIKLIYANLIEQIGWDSGACCEWMGYDALSVEEWKAQWWRCLQEYGRYEQSIGAFDERKRIAHELLTLNDAK